MKFNCFAPVKENALAIIRKITFIHLFIHLSNSLTELFDFTKWSLTGSGRSRKVVVKRELTDRLFSTSVVYFIRPSRNY